MSHKIDVIVETSANISSTTPSSKLERTMTSIARLWKVNFARVNMMIVSA